MKTQTRSLPQNRKLHMLLGKLKLDPEVKQDIIYKATLGRTTSSKDLYQSEADILINELNRMLNADPAQRMRRKIFSICHELGWRLPASQKVDVQRLNNWLMKYGYLHKPLMAYTYQELPALVSQLEEILKKSYNEKS